MLGCYRMFFLGHIAPNFVQCIAATILLGRGNRFQEKQTLSFLHTPAEAILLLDGDDASTYATDTLDFMGVK